jgi:CBS domain-containing protein
MKPILVKDYMTTKLVTFRPGMDILVAMEMLIRGGISGGPVVDDDGMLVGVLSEKDCLKVGLDYSFNKVRPGFVSSYMERGVETVDILDSVSDVALLFSEKHFRRFPVLDRERDDKLVGQISRRDVMKAVVDIIT